MQALVQILHRRSNIHHNGSTSFRPRLDNIPLFFQNLPEQFVVGVRQIRDYANNHFPPGNVFGPQGAKCLAKYFRIGLSIASSPQWPPKNVGDSKIQIRNQCQPRLCSCDHIWTSFDNQVTDAGPTAPCDPIRPRLVDVRVGKISRKIVPVCFANSIDFGCQIVIGSSHGTVGAGRGHQGFGHHRFKICA